jgi:hypothetical protein
LFLDLPAEAARYDAIFMNNYIERIFGRYWGSNHVPRHTFQYDRTHLRKLLTDAGFTSVAFQYELNTGTLAASFQNVLQRNAPSLRNNPRLTYGRMKGFELLLLAVIPLNVLPWIMKRSGVMTFIARKQNLSAD